MAEQKYRVIKRLEAGGMAEVYVGEAEGVQGFKKRVAIKRVLPHLAKNQSFIEMFLDEARLSAKLNHANIVSVFDISAREDTYFLIMEFVDGANLKKIMESLQQRAQRIRLADAVSICIEACRGLSYAHELADEQGVQLGIVHRDISPPNIMVTKRGEVKVADFGLAKAGTQVVTTDPGVVKGKFSYLSPEAAQGLAVDARADIFSLGIVLWEMLAGRRLFYGQTDYATVKLIQNANVPRLVPLNREVDEEFELIVLRALAKDPKNRFQSAREFGDALSGYLFTRQLKVTSYDLANLVRSSVSDEQVDAPEKPASTKGRTELSLIDRLIQEELDASVGISSGDAPRPSLAAGPGRVPSIRPSGSGSFEDPSSWFSDDSDLMGAAASPGGGPDASASWRESGVPMPPPALGAPTPARGPAPAPARAPAPPSAGGSGVPVPPDEILLGAELRTEPPPSPPGPPPPPAPGRAPGGGAKRPPMPAPGPVLDPRAAAEAAARSAAAAREAAAAYGARTQRGGGAAVTPTSGGGMSMKLVIIGVVIAVLVLAVVIGVVLL